MNDEQPTDKTVELIIPVHPGEAYDPAALSRAAFEQARRIGQYADRAAERWLRRLIAERHPAADLGRSILVRYEIDPADGVLSRLALVPYNEATPGWREASADSKIPTLEVALPGYAPEPEKKTG